MMNSTTDSVEIITSVATRSREETVCSEVPRMEAISSLERWA